MFNSNKVTENDNEYEAIKKTLPYTKMKKKKTLTTYKSSTCLNQTTMQRKLTHL